MYRNVSLKMDKIFPKYHIAYFGLFNFFNNGYLFSNDAVFRDTLYYNNNGVNPALLSSEFFI